MNNPEDNAARLTLKMAGVFQEVRDIWVKRLDDYYNQIESLIAGQWLGPNDMPGILKEVKAASKEALDGLGVDLSSELVHESRGVFVRFESERQSLIEEINDLRNSLSLVKSGDEGLLRSENADLRHALLQIPEYLTLDSIRKLRRCNYDDLSKRLGIKKSTVRKLSKQLLELGYIAIDKKSRPHSLVFLRAPWRAKMNQESAAEVNGMQDTYKEVSH